MFPVDLGDLFHEEIEEDFVLAVLDMMLTRDDADWVVLTKRAKRMYSIIKHWLEFNELKRVPAHIWLMVTAENQKRADERIPILLQIKAQVRGVSLEPMLEPIDLSGPWHVPGHNVHATTEYLQDMLHWVIVGAESGPERRLFEVSWAEDVYEQCKIAGVPFFFKQQSGLRPGTNPTLGGHEIKEFPR